MADKLDLEAFKESLLDVAAVGEKLSSHFAKTEDLIGAIKLALDNEGQLSLLASVIYADKKK